MDILSLNKKFFKNFKGKKIVIGTSLLGHPILCYGIIKSPYPKAIIQGSIHAREYITGYLTLKLIKDFYKILNYLDGSNIKKMCGDIALEVIKTGAYYGYIIENKSGLEV